MSEERNISEDPMELGSTSMEAHHHPEQQRKSKTWKEYLLEFFMIFLAVTLGFFAENVRERIIEKKMEMDTIASFQNELKKDTARLNTLINIYTPTHNLWTDSVRTLIHSSNIKGNEKKVFQAVVNAIAWQLYSTPEIALNILKNSGYFNLIENVKLKTEILEYDGIVKSYSNYSAFISGVEHSVDTSTLSLYTLNDGIAILKQMYLASQKDGQYFVTENTIPDNIRFITYDKSTFLAFLKKLEQVTLLLNDMNIQYLAIRDQEIKLLNLIEEEYPE